ncbi:dTDP-glucose 4,6-dehydratase [Thalassoglobus neptunius]|uniref:dTDP-glucose 4,6-dehydratase n=1 Tax=Thalassoglobus neptunius TaxID=1938619 RepID=A0A5C5WQB5_9PLAN|nr:NAD(P)-dependent oxidoreductase [Thalassoglobus neptunius]TWT52281.1 dTDP-glucose 4,6-dehydratase [Thalassoglobus neptunius]
MRVGVTGATGFIGRYLVYELVQAGHTCLCLSRPSSDRGGFEEIADSITWIEGSLGDGQEREFVSECDAIAHTALFHPSGKFMGGEGDLIPYLDVNLMGTLKLIDAAFQASVERFVFVSTCAVHDVILDDRPLDETHPLWMKSHYGAHKAAIEMFVHSYGLGQGMPISAVRPTGVYGVNRPVENSKWAPMVQAIINGEPVNCSRGGKEVHAADVAKAIHLCLKADAEEIKGRAFNCYDRYISQFDVATLAKSLTGSSSEITGGQTSPKNQIETNRLRELGMKFGGTALFERTIEELIAGLKS